MTEVSTPSKSSRRRFWPFRPSRNLLGYLLVLPILIVVLGVTLYPTLDGVRLAFTDASLLNPGAVRYIGLENFTRLFSSDIFWVVLGHSLLLTVVAVTIQFVLGLILAHLLATDIPGMQVFRSVAMVTWVLPIIATVVMFKFMAAADYGFFNLLLTQLGLGDLTRYWFGDRTYAFVLIVIMHVWRNVPFYAVAFMASMQAIPVQLYEAARIDGASSWAQLRYVTLPNLRYIIQVMVILHITFTFNNFDFIYLSTGGGPVNATEVLPTFAYEQAWEGYALGYGAASGVIMLVVLVGVTILYLRFIGGVDD